MIDLGIDKLALIGVVALVVIGPEKLPRVARTVGTLLGKAQRYVADVKAEVNRSMELEELRKMKTTVEETARHVEQSVHAGVSDIEQQWSDAASAYGSAEPEQTSWVTPRAYRPPRKNWRLKRSATPQWYKARQGIRTKALSGAARVARYRPKKFN